MCASAGRTSPSVGRWACRMALLAAQWPGGGCAAGRTGRCGRAPDHRSGLAAVRGAAWRRPAELLLTPKKPCTTNWTRHAIQAEFSARLSSPRAGAVPRGGGASRSARSQYGVGAETVEQGIDEGTHLQRQVPTGQMYRIDETFSRYIAGQHLDQATFLQVLADDEGGQQGPGRGRRARPARGPRRR